MFRGRKGKFPGGANQNLDQPELPCIAV
jgi:hypothetical protein